MGETNAKNGDPKRKRIRKSCRRSLNLYSHKDRIINIDWVFYWGGFTEKILPLKITRKSSELLWSPQWSLSKEKSKALHQLVGEQLENGHIGPPSSPWNAPIFVIKIWQMETVGLTYIMLMPPCGK